MADEAVLAIEFFYLLFSLALLASASASADFVSC
jgi:hypothetical protein